MKLTIKPVHLLVCCLLGCNVLADFSDAGDTPLAGEDLQHALPLPVELKVLKVYYGPPCPPGFMRPPGVRECMAGDDVYSPDTDAPAGLCPKEHWYRPKEINYCIPRRDLYKSKILKAVVIEHDLIDRVEEPGWLFNLCPRGTVEIWWEMPRYDKKGLFAEFVPARSCIPEGLTPEG